MPGGSFSSASRDLSADGSVVVGTGGSGWGEEPFVWDATKGTQEIGQALIDLGLDAGDLAGRTVRTASDISDDGLTMVGHGTNPSGDAEAWIPVLRAPTAALRGLQPRVTVSTMRCAVTRSCLMLTENSYQ